MSNKHVLFVCKTCNFSKAERERDGLSGGQHLLDKLTELYKDWPLQDKISLEAVECLSACSNSCAIALSASGKYTYVFGDVSPLDSAEAVLECANLYVEKSDGFLPWSERPEKLKKGILVRIPPIPSLSAADRAQ